MKRKFKIVSFLMILCCSLALLSCGNSTSGSSSKTSKADLDSAAEGYINAYLGKDVDYDKLASAKDELENLVYKRDYHVVNLYTMEGGKDAEILQAYYDALKNVEYTIKTSNSSDDGGKVTVAVKGIDISEVENEVRTFSIKTRREKKMSREELNKVTEDKAVELLKAVTSGEEKEIELEFTKNSDGKLELSDSSIDNLENTLSFMQDNYTKFTGDVPQEFKDIEVK